jgi:hypothetical protein
MMVAQPSGNKEFQAIIRQGDGLKFFTLGEPSTSGRDLR